MFAEINPFPLIPHISPPIYFFKNRPGPLFFLKP